MLDSAKHKRSPHTFHIPVMGIAFTIDTPIKVAPFGISSVISIGDDILIEKMRKYHSQNNEKEYNPINENEHDFRAKRIRAYLNLVHEIVETKFHNLKNEAFEKGNNITKYFEMLPDSQLKTEYQNMLTLSSEHEKIKSQNRLREKILPGSIDVNIMTKLDRDLYIKGELQQPEYALAMSAMRGYATSNLCSSIVLSAGINRRLFTYMSNFDDFYPANNTAPKKQIILKVSDYRSALIQGKMFAKMGLWVSEYRLESGLNCGGHAFGTKGELIGPVLEEFKKLRNELKEKLQKPFKSGLESRKKEFVDLDFRLTIQGGIGTYKEAEFLKKTYGCESTGWGTPFLLVPEVTNVDEEHLQKLLKATENDVELSYNSPLGIPFWCLKNSSSEIRRKKRIENGKPGSPCTQGFLVSDTEFTKVPICKASRLYQSKKIKQIESSQMESNKKNYEINNLLKKACICVDLGSAVLLKNNIEKNINPSICTGPGISHFNKIATLEEMVNHIYGRISLNNLTDRPHMFMTELKLYIDTLSSDIKKSSEGFIEQTKKNLLEYRNNIVKGINYYRELASEFELSETNSFLKELEKLSKEIETLTNNLIGNQEDREALVAFG
ncbi:MAG: hypothetical protein DRP35_09445 [Candidatus Zixiibacteriota bacterium]|nr:MAG: hypothetical protein DRP35_09445 [candidate division Zixibacteria bacterium]